jgi:hypothetical protein
MYMQSQETLVAPTVAIDRTKAAKYLDLSTRSIANRMADGSLPYIKLNARCVRFLIKDLDAFLESHRIGG